MSAFQTLNTVPLHIISIHPFSVTGILTDLRSDSFVESELTRVDSEISAFMTGFDRAVTVDLGAAGGCGEHAGMAAAGRLDD